MKNIKMLKLIAYFGLILFLNTTEAQKYKKVVTEGTGHKFPKKFSIHDVFENNESYYYIGSLRKTYFIITPVVFLFMPHPYGISIVKINSKGEKEEEIKVKTPNIDDRVIYKQTLSLEKYIFVMYTVFNKELKKTFIFTTRIDNTTKEQKIFKIGELDDNYAKLIRTKSSSTVYQFDFRISENKNYFSIIYSKQNDYENLNYAALSNSKAKSKRKSSIFDKFNPNLKKINYVVYDTDLNTVNYAKSLNFDSLNKNETISNFTLLNNGQIALITSIKKEYSNYIGKKEKLGSKDVKTKKNSYKLGFLYKLYILNYDKANYYKLTNSSDSGDRGNKSVYLKETLNKIKLFGVYTNTGSISNGIESWELNLKNNFISSSKLSPFPEVDEKVDFSESDISDKPKKNIKKLLKESNPYISKGLYYTKNIVHVGIVNDTAYQVVCEQFKVNTVTTITTTTTNGQRTQRSRDITYYYYGPGSIINIDSSLKFKNAKFIEYSIVTQDYDPGYGAIFKNLKNDKLMCLTRDGFALYDNNINKMLTDMEEFRKNTAGNKRRAFKSVILNDGIFIVGYYLGRNAYPLFIRYKSKI